MYSKKGNWAWVGDGVRNYKKVHKMDNCDDPLFSSLPICKLMNQHLSALASKFPQTKFLRSVSSVCIPNYPDKNLPTVFVYFESDMKKQFVGPLAFGGMNVTQNGK